MTSSKTATRSPKPTPATKAKSPRPLAKTVAPRAAKTLAPVSAVAQAELGKAEHKLVRDSFTIPKSEYVVLQSLKLRAAQLQRPTKKGELIRAGIVALGAMSDKAFLAAVDKVPSIKTGRPRGTDVEAKSE